MNKELETEANRFAVDLLCPQESVRKSIEEGLSISDLADKYQVEECVIKEALKRSNKTGRELLRKERDGWTHSELCRIAEEWLLRGNRCRVAIAEPACWAATEQPDAIGWSASASWLVEAKVSRSDFLADRKKVFRIDPRMGMGSLRYYICPDGLISIDELPPLWGLLYVLPSGTVRVKRHSDIFWEASCKEERLLLAACLYIKKPLKIKGVRFNVVQTLWKEII